MHSSVRLFECAEGRNGRTYRNGDHNYLQIISFNKQGRSHEIVWWNWKHCLDRVYESNNGIHCGWLDYDRHDVGEFSLADVMESKFPSFRVPERATLNTECVDLVPDEQSGDCCSSERYKCLNACKIFELVNCWVIKQRVSSSWQDRQCNGKTWNTMIISDITLKTQTYCTRTYLSLLEGELMGLGWFV